MAPALLSLSPSPATEHPTPLGTAALNVMEPADRVLEQIDQRYEDVAMLKFEASPADTHPMGPCERHELELGVEQQAEFSRDQANAIVSSSY